MAEFLKITLNNFRIKRGKQLWRQKTSYFRLCFNLTRGNFLAGLRFVHLNFSPDLVASFELETIDLRFYRVWKFQSAFHSSIILLIIEIPLLEVMTLLFALLSSNLQLVWRSHDKLNTLHLHLQKTYGHQTGHGGDIL